MISLLTLLSWSPLAAAAEPPPGEARFAIGEGLVFDFEDGTHQIGITGFVQPSWQVSQETDGEIEQIWQARRTQLAFVGDIDNERYGFRILTDFSLSAPLLEAWMRYRVHPTLTVSIGQRLTPANNREMLYNEGNLAFPQRGIVSTTFSETGRELGLFVDGQFDAGRVSVRPSLAVTSGDGRNSFGVDSRDVDYGGLKWGGRLDVYPVGDFSEGNRGHVMDLVHEPKPKLVFGGAMSFNDGASGPTGEGHGGFLIYGPDGTPQLPDYFKFHGDLLFKVRGVSVLAEFSRTSAASLQGTFTDTVGANPLFAGQIAEFLSLGQALGLQVGYHVPIGLSFDVRAGLRTPEFADNDASIVDAASTVGGGVTVWLRQPGARIQAVGTYVNRENGPNAVNAELAAIVHF